ncbi:MAG: alkaline phosphatase [Rikenellaceae bacterium]|nr:alkaline phosphatase [Rikenellaceae bacterium]MCL2691846.1 alkaline phosphatase [Rikenellaceae bacterium]
MKNLIAVIFCLFAAFGARAEGIKNVIFMIPDGASISSVSLARWYKQYTQGEGRLSFDPYISGFVRSHSSNAPIGDSAPTASAYMTGKLTQAGFLSMLPPPCGNDLVEVDPALAYTPRMTLFEAARIAGGKAIGLVVTCEFTHATPAATSAHWYARNDYATISEQMIHNSIDVVMGGGTKFLSDAQERFLQTYGYTVLRDDLAGFRSFGGGRLWALFGDEYMDYDTERDTLQQPSLAEMTHRAIEILSQREEGFCLLVEGSKIDWAAHDNDRMRILSEMLAFDEAARVALDFARACGRTLVIICPDHGTGGVSIGDSGSSRNYSRLSLGEIFGHIGFTTGGHTGEDVFLAVYDPRGRALGGLVTAPQVNAYIMDAMALGATLDELTAKYYARRAADCDLHFEANSSIVRRGNEVFRTKVPAIFVDRTGEWFVSKELKELLK